MKFQCYLCFDLEIEPFLLIFGLRVSTGEPVSLPSLFSDPDPMRILLLFLFLLLLCSKAVITLAARYLLWRARVELQLQQFDDEDSRESLRICLKFV